jgi:hypothetical protein
MSNIEVTNTSWFTRLKNALTGIVVGIILIIATSILLFWNEARAVKTYQSLAEGKAAVVTANAEVLDSGLEGKLIHVQGAITPNSDPEDITSGVWAEGAVSLKRTVEMYQWIETQESKTEKKLGGGEETVTTYSYAKGWTMTPQTSSDFYTPEGHENPAFPLDQAQFNVTDANLGAYVVAGDVLAPLGTSQIMDFSDEEAQAIGEALGLTAQTAQIAGALYAGNNPDSPEVGDVKVVYERVDLTEASFVAKQVGNGLQEYATSNGYTVFLSSAGLVPSVKLFADAQDANTFLTWILRAVGLIFMFAGFAASLKVLSVSGDVIPFVGTIIGFGTGLFSFIATLCLGSLMIALGWFAARPLLSIVIILGAALIVAGITYMKKRQVVAVV